MNNLPKVKPSSSGISSTSFGDEQSQLVLSKSFVFDDSSSSSRDLSKTLTKDDVKRFSPALNKTTQNVPPLIYQKQQATTYQVQSSTQANQTQSSIQVNQVQTTSVSGRIPVRKPDVYDDNTSINEWVDSMKAYFDGTNPAVVMDRVRVSQIKLFMGPSALRRVKHVLKDEFCDWDVLKKCLETVFVTVSSIQHFTVIFCSESKGAMNHFRRFSMSYGHFATKWRRSYPFTTMTTNDV